MTLFAGKVFWPRDLLKEISDLKSVKISTWGYNADVVKAFDFASKASIFAHATNLLLDISNERLLGPEVEVIVKFRNFE